MKGVVKIGAVVLLFCITATPLEGVMTRTMFGHVLIQIPLLVAIGFILGQQFEPKLDYFLDRWNAAGIPGILLTSFVLAFWMIPRWLDASLISDLVAFFKYVSLVAIAGVPLAISWRRLPVIARGVVKIEFLAMLFRLGWLYMISPERLCNSYLLADQARLGLAMILVGAALSLTWLIPVFLGELPGAAKVER